mmetsp:Transcript_10771/g.23368  ORF Transcript_10771/g.23368 Transcript_10771/m.23368 type:complete len:732 (+) Transcript_10771:2323-4518(+)
MSDINAIFAAMKEEAEDELRLRCMTKPKKMKKKKKQREPRNDQARSVLFASNDNDNNSAPPPSPPPPPPVPPKVALDIDSRSSTTCKQDTTILKTSILAWSREKDPNSMHALGDSDDEDSFDDGDNLTSTSTARGWSIDRFSSAINSSDVSSRLDGLTALHLAITELLATVGNNFAPPPPLNLPPPYDPNRIALTHREQGALVSDMAPDQWSEWNRTHSTLMSQFQTFTCTDATSDSSTPLDASSNNSTSAQLQALLNGCGCAIFRCFGDEVEKCRSLALRCANDIALSGVDFGKHVGLLMPALFVRIPPVSFDAEMNVFVHNAEEHDCHRRGGAVTRQDKDDSRTIAVVETSEELRLGLCEFISSLIRGAVARNSLSILDPYFSDLVLALYTMLRDPCPDVKVRASDLLTQLVRVPHWEPGSKVFALALARAAVPNLRHRNARVRLATIGLFEASVCVPNRAKIRGAGSDGIVDLIGFKEDNVIPIASYYSAQCNVAVNFLAELAIDKNARVRERCCEMLAYFMVCLPDRYDHQTRLLPYVLNLYLDPVVSIRQLAMGTVDRLGAQYEAEHPEEIIERRQYGVDGDGRCNYSNLPPPFQRRPRLGARIFVRSNTRRFLTALLMELSFWRSKTRDQSAELLKVLIVYNEEHLVRNLSKTLPLVVKGLQVATSDVKSGDRTSEALVESLEACLELMGRYISEEVYQPLLSKDGDQYVKALDCMMRGSKNYRR